MENQIKIFISKVKFKLQTYKVIKGVIESYVLSTLRTVSIS